MTNEEKAELVANGIMIGVQSSFYHTNVYNVNVRCYNHSDLKRAAMEMAKWKDEQFKEREEGLRGTIDAIDASLQKANEYGIHYFDKCNNIQKQHEQSLIDLNCKLEEQQANYEELKKRYDEAVEREKIATKIINELRTKLKNK